MRRREGFTLVEILVAMTLTIFIMVNLSQAFVQGLETFSGLKAIGDMQERLRTDTNIIRADLSPNHFEGTRRLSDPDIVTVRPREGFVRIVQPTPSLPDGVDPIDPVLGFPEG